MKYDFREEVKSAKKAAMGELYNLAKENLKPGMKIINFASGHPSTEVFQDKMIKEYFVKALGEGEKDVLQYGPHLGYAPLRSLFKDFANKKGPTVKENDDLMITYGNVEGIYIVATALLNKNDYVVVEEPSYVNAIKAFQLVGARLCSVPQENDGVDLKTLEEIFQSGCKIYYTIPNFGNPSGISMSETKREAVYKLAVKYNVLILEDNAYGELRYRGDRISNIKEYDKSGNVIYLCSMSKLIAPAMRIAFLVANKQLINKFAVIKAITTNGVSQIVQKALHIMFEENDMYVEIEKICNVYRKKLECMEDSIQKFFPQSTKCSHPDGGMYLWVTMPDGFNINHFCRRCAVELAVPMTPGNGFYIDNNPKCTSMRLNFVKESLEDIECGISKVGALLYDERTGID